jgi:hypothetical protein
MNEQTFLKKGLSLSLSLFHIHSLSLSHTHTHTHKHTHPKELFRHKEEQNHVICRKMKKRFGHIYIDTEERGLSTSQREMPQMRPIL